MTPTGDAGRAKALLDFWFGPKGAPERDRPRAVWFKPQPEFDAALRRRFGADQALAAAGGHSHWQAGPETCLALVLLLDQLPRNLFRGSPQAYDCDGLARAAARHALAEGFDRAMAPVRRWFFYLPFQHSEDPVDQALSLALHAGLPEDEDKAQAVASARRHHEIIARFGRFPHRNRILGRISTAEEEAFLALPGSSF
jgi:uncharacterized protein (DUF924 family)